MLNVIDTPAGLNFLAQKSLLARRIGDGIVTTLISVFLVLSLNTQASAQTSTKIRAQAKPLNANQDYSEGLQAYLNGNFTEAQSSWLKSAKAKDAKSMFNLGLLHQQGKLNDSDSAKAEQWFRLSGKNGYAAGYYHLADWFKQRGEPSQKVNELLSLAANAGFSPAMKAIGVTKETVVSQSREVESVSPPASIVYNGENYIRSLPGGNWTIQMLAFEERNKVLEFIDTHELHQQAAYFIEPTNSGDLYKLIYGSYQDKEQAEVARDKLPKQLMEHGPWLRSIAGVQSIVNAR